MTRLALGLVLIALAAPASAATPHAVVSDAYLQVTIAESPAAGYFTLQNKSDSPLTLTGASSPNCASMMLHQSVTNGGMAEMSMLESVVVPPRGSVTFAPGGYHLMCMKPSAVFFSGQTTTIVTLQFANGDALTVPFRVQGVKP